MGSALLFGSAVDLSGSIITRDFAGQMFMRFCGEIFELFFVHAVKHVPCCAHRPALSFSPRLTARTIVSVTIPCNGHASRMAPATKAARPKSTCQVRRPLCRIAKAPTSSTIPEKTRIATITSSAARVAAKGKSTARPHWNRDDTRDPEQCPEPARRGIIYHTLTCHLLSFLLAREGSVFVVIIGVVKDRVPCTLHFGPGIGHTVLQFVPGRAAPLLHGPERLAQLVPTVAQRFQCFAGLLLRGVRHLGPVLARPLFKLGNLGVDLRKRFAHRRHGLVTLVFGIGTDRLKGLIEFSLDILGGHALGFPSLFRSLLRCERQRQHEGKCEHARGEYAGTRCHRRGHLNVSFAQLCVKLGGSGGYGA